MQRQQIKKVYESKIKEIQREREREDKQLLKERQGGSKEVRKRTKSKTFPGTSLKFALVDILVSYVRKQVII